jgi:hypothetical protein
MRDVQTPITTTLEHFELAIEAFHKPPWVPGNKVVRSVVEPVLSRGQKAITATDLPRSSRLHPLPNLTLPRSFAQLRIP